MMMNAKIWTATCSAIAFGAVVGVFAQNPPPSQTSPSASAKTITITGCVQRAQESPTGTSGTTPSATETKFVLSNAAMSTTGTTGTAGTANPPSTAVASQYRLDGDDAKLTPHVGHKVEITGMVEQPTRSTQPPAASAANAPTLKVDSVKMLTATCP
jgi:hypothetical protein